MINSLQSAFQQAEGLSPEDQELLALLILDELKWTQSFSQTKSSLSLLAEQALGEYKSGEQKRWIFSMLLLTTERFRKCYSNLPLELKKLLRNLINYGC